MATKAELVAYASSVGVDVSESWTKADIEGALYDAGYDPTNIGEATVTETTPDDVEEWTDAIGNMSSDATFSTYTEVPPDPEVMPPPGRQVEQTRGEASEGGGQVFGANR